jgi:hypothetical protein
VLVPTYAVSSMASLGWGTTCARRPAAAFRFTGRLERIDVLLGDAAELTSAELLEEHLHAD